MQSKPGRNSPIPEIGLKCFLTQQSGAISSKTTLQDSAPLILVFIYVACASVLLGMRRHLQQHAVARLIQILEDGSTQRDVAAAFGVTQSVVSLYLATGGYVRRPGQGRLRCTATRQDRYIRQMAVRRRHSTARALQIDFLQASGQRISDKTVCNRLHENGLHSRRPARGPILTREHRRARLDCTGSRTLAAASLASHSLHKRVQIPCLYL